MRVLALDTTRRALSAALVDDAGTCDERGSDPSHGCAEQLPGEVAAIVRAHSLSFTDIDLYAVASGPGSFTGLRIGIATLQGLAFVSGRRVLAVSALDALAHAALSRGTSAAFVGAWIDARRGEVFAGLYRVAYRAAFDPEALIELQPPTVGRPPEMLARWRVEIDLSSTTFVGDGAVAYASTIRDSAGAGVEVLDVPLLAGAIGRLALARSGKATDPAAVRPLYIRRPDAEIARDRARTDT
jgi:tRNA threonylcarbamoyladenosine biosynthesis protein TsaB